MNTVSYPFLKESTEITKQHWDDDVPPLLSIVNNTYNHEYFIAESIEGFLMQKTTFKVEILVHDDASTDKTATIIHEYEKKYPGLILPIYQTTNQYSQGISPNREYQLPRTRGKYIAVCEGDDYWTDTLKLQKQIDFLENNQSYSLSWCRFKTLNEDTGEINIDKNEKLFDDENKSLDFDFERFYNGWHMGTQTLVYRKAMFDANIYSVYKYTRDVHVVSHLLLKGKGVCLNFFGAVYRKHEGGIYSSLSKIQSAKTGHLCYRELYKNNHEIIFLKLKYFRFTKKYIRVLIKNKIYKEAFQKSYELFLINKDFQYLLKTAKAIVFQNHKYLN